MDTAPLSQTAREKKECIEASVMLTKNGRPRSLQQRMKDFTIPGVSIALINDYQREWACGYGLRKMGEDEVVEPETLFQSCSISKAVTAIAVLRLGEEGRLDIDADVNTYLRSWKVLTNGVWQPRVTIRQLLSHTAGVTPPWFAGYHRDQDLPTFPEVLNGEQPTNSPEIRVSTIPGLRFRYSGGGYCILQQLLTDVMKQPFPDLMHELVLSPLGMIHSSYDQPLSAQRSKIAAAGHRKSGKPVAGDCYIYPELAAAGLWTTPSDLAQLALELQRVLAGQSHRLLSRQMVQELLTPQSQGDARGAMGLGIFVQGNGPSARFGHPGDNAGFTSCWVSLMQGGQGCVIMTNSDNGWSLQEELLHIIAEVYAWPELPSQESHAVSSEEDITLLENYSGDYQLQSGLFLRITTSGHELLLQMPDQPSLKLLRQSDTTFLCAGPDEIITFVNDAQGQALAIILGPNQEIAMKRSPNQVADADVPL